MSYKSPLDLALIKEQEHQKAIDPTQLGARRENAHTLAKRKSEALRNESELYSWLRTAMEVSPPTPEVEHLLYDMILSSYRRNTL